MRSIKILKCKFDSFESVDTFCNFVVSSRDPTGVGLNETICEVLLLRIEGIPNLQQFAAQSLSSNQVSKQSASGQLITPISARSPPLVK